MPDQQSAAPRHLRELAFWNLVVAVLSDRKVRTPEEDFLDQARNLLGLDEAHARACILRAQAEPVRIRVPETAEEKAYCFGLMVAACKADGMIHPLEAQMLRGAAPFFGVDEDALRQYLRGARHEAVTDPPLRGELD